jgi:hypothetical protein
MCKGVLVAEGLRSREEPHMAGLGQQAGTKGGDPGLVCRNTLAFQHNSLHLAFRIL